MILRIFLVSCLVASQHQCEAFGSPAEWLQAIARLWNALLSFFDAKISFSEQTMTTIIELLRSAITNGTNIFSSLFSPFRRRRDERNTTSSLTNVSSTAAPLGPPGPGGPGQGSPGGPGQGSPGVPGPGTPGFPGAPNPGTPGVPGGTPSSP